MTTNDQAGSHDSHDAQDEMGDETSASSASSSGAGTAGVRLPYRTPQLRHLGSVRELTLGGTPIASEGGGTKGRPVVKGM